MWRFHQFPEIQNLYFYPRLDLNSWPFCLCLLCKSYCPTGAHHHNRLKYAFLMSIFFSFKRGVRVEWVGWGPRAPISHCIASVPSLISSQNLESSVKLTGVIMNCRWQASGSSSLITSSWEAYRPHRGVLSFACHRTLLWLCTHASHLRVVTPHTGADLWKFYSLFK